MRVLLTGATGFIGSHVAGALVQAGHEVSCLVRPGSNRWRLEQWSDQLRWRQGDLCDERLDLCDRSGFEAVVHLAAYGVQHRDDDWPTAVQTNVLGAGRLIETAAAGGARRVIVAGSCMEYGQGSGGPHVPPGENGQTVAQRLGEGTVLRPLSWYGAAKAAATQVALAAAYQCRLPLVILRPFHVYGPMEDGDKFVPSIICRGLEGQEIAMTEGQQRRDYCYVGDVAQAFVAALTAPLPASDPRVILNLGTGRGRPLIDVARAVLRHIPEAGALRSGALQYRHDEIWDLVPDVSAAKLVLGWEATTSLAQGLRQTVEWYRRHQATELQRGATSRERERAPDLESSAFRVQQTTSAR